MAPIHPFTKQMVPSLCPESLTRSLWRSFPPVLCVRLIKGFLPPKTFLRARGFFFLFLFFFVCFFHFHRTLFRGHTGACVNPGSFFQTLFLCIHFFVAPACLHVASDWPRTFFTPKVFLFSILLLFVNKYHYFVEAYKQMLL